MYINHIVNYINSQGRFETSKEIIENAWWFSVSSLLGLLQPRISYKNLPLNYFGITIASSSAGKSFSLDKAIELLNPNMQGYKKIILQGFEKANMVLPFDDEEGEILIEGSKVPLKNFLPTDFTINIEGTPEGLYLRALALSHSWCGSLNVINEEILDIVKDSNLNRMKELYDGKFNAKIIKSNVNRNIEDINANMLIFGSSIGLKRSLSTYQMFSNALNSGIYRRSFIYYEPPKERQFKNEENRYNVETIEFVVNNIKEFIKCNIDKRLEGESIVIPVSINDRKYEEINHELLEFSNQHLDDERFNAELGSFDKIVKLATLHAIAGGSQNVVDDDIGYAYDFYKRCRDTVQDLFNTEPQHKRIYKLIKQYGELTKSEILEKDIFQRNTFNEDIGLVYELAYRNNEVLVERGHKIKRYSIEPLPRTDLNKIIVSIAIDGKGAKSVLFKNLELPFFGERNSIEKLVRSENYEAFSFVHYDGKRSDKNAIEGQNAIAFDFDEGITIEEAQEILKPFTYILYTTKSHAEENHRFRVILPTKHKFYVNPEQHKGLIENIANLLGLPSYDVATRNISRLWFTNPYAVVLKNEGDLLDVLCCIPETESEKYITKAENENIDDITKDKRIHGMIRWTIANAYKGNRNSSLFRLMKFLIDLRAENVNEIVYRTNALIDEPLPEWEIQKMLRHNKS